MAWQDYLDTVQEAYIAYYQRPADPVGLVYWAQRLDLAKGDLSQIIDAFANSDEAKALYGDINENTIGDVIDQIYQAAFNRAPDDAGKQFYIKGFKEGKFTPATIMLDILNGAQNDDLIILQNKVTSAMNFTKTIDPELDGKDLLATYDANDIQAARDYLKDVGATIDTVKDAKDAQSFIKEKIADENDPIKVQSGTEDYERTLTPQIEKFEGTDGDDTINGIRQFVSQSGIYVDTLNSGDTVDGKGGIDTLNAVTAAGNVVPTLKNIEKINWTDYNNAAGGVFDLIKSDTSITDFTIDGPIGNVTVQNFKNVPNISIKNDVGGNNVTLQFLDSAIAANNNELNITVDNDNLTTLDIDNTLRNQQFNKLNITATGADTYIQNIGNNGPRDAIVNTSEVKISGDANIYLGLDNQGVVVGGIGTTSGLTRMASLNKVNASEATGNVYINVPVARDLDIKTGSGDDFVDLGNTLNVRDKIDLGEGNNTLAITGNANPATGSYDVANVNTLQVTTDTTPTVAGATVKADAFGDGIEKIKGIIAANNNTFTINNLKDDADFEVQDANGGIIRTAGAIALNLANTSGTDNKINITIRGNDSNNDTDNDNINEFTIASITANGIENINLNSTKTGRAPIENKLTALNVNAAQKLTITGDTDLTIGNNLGIKEIDATAMTGSVDLTIQGNGTVGGEQTVKTGSGNDFIRVANTNINEKVTIDAGDGSDTLALTDAGAINWAGVTNSSKLANLHNFENVTLTSNGGALTIDDSTLNMFTNNTLNFKAQNLGLTSLDASGVVNSNATINVDTTGITAAVNGFRYTMSNGHNHYTGGAGVDTVVLTNVNYLHSDDTINGGTGNNIFIIQNQDTATGANPDPYTYTSDKLEAITGFSTIEIGESAVANANKVTLNLSNNFVANNANPANSTLTINANAAAIAGVYTPVVADKLKIDGSNVSAAYKLNITGGGADDTIIGGAGDDTIIGGAAQDKIDLSAGGKDKVVVAAGANADVISGFTLHGPNATADNDIDKLDFNAFNNGAIMKIDEDGTTPGVQTDPTTGNTPANYNEITENGMFVNNGITVLTGKGYADVNAAMNAIATNGTLAANDEGILVFYDTSTLKTEVYYVVNDATAAWGGAGDAATLYAQLSGVSLDDLANFDADNFIV